MSRQPSAYDLAELARLTSLREALATERLARATAALIEVDKRVEALRAERFPDIGLNAAALCEKWQLWRQEELRRLAIRRAALAAEHRRAALENGRFVAENAVLARLQSRSKKARASRAARLQSYNS